MVLPHSVIRVPYQTVVEHTRLLFTDYKLPVGLFFVQSSWLRLRHETSKLHLIRFLYHLQTVCPTNGVTNHTTQHAGVYVNIVFSSESNGPARIRGPQP